MPFVVPHQLGKFLFGQDEVFLNGTIVLPHKEIKESVLDCGTIIM